MLAGLSAVLLACMINTSSLGNVLRIPRAAAGLAAKALPLDEALCTKSNVWAFKELVVADWLILAMDRVFVVPAADDVTDRAEPVVKLFAVTDMPLPSCHEIHAPLSIRSS